MNAQIRMLLVLIAIGFTVQGCTRQVWYEGLKARQKQECMQYPSTGEVQRCLDNMPGSYNQYQHDRENGR